MKKSVKMFIISVCLALVLAVGLKDNVVLGDSAGVLWEEVASLEENVEWRIFYGLDSDRSYVEDVMKNPYKYYAGYFAVTDLEYEELVNRLKNIPILHEINNDLKNKYSDIFGGMVYDHKTGKGKIMLTKQSVELETYIKSRKENIELELEYVKFTQKELEETAEKLFDTKINISSFRYSIIDNIVYVEVNNSNNLLGGLDNIINGLDAIINLDHIRILTVTESPQPASLFEGAQISKSSGGSCSSGFKAKNSTNYFLVTAGHCDLVANYGKSLWKYGSTSLGNWTREVTSTTWQYSDSGLIRLSGSSAMGTQVRTATSDEFVGQTIYKKGYKTSVTYGTYDGVSGTYTFGTYDSDGFTYKYSGVVVGSNWSQSGDSGGIVYTHYYGDGGGYNLKGTVNT